MEASVAAGTGGEGTTEAAEGAAPAVDLSPVLEQVGAIGQRLDTFETTLQGLRGEPEGDGGEGEGVDDDTLAALAELFGPQAGGQELDGETASRLVDGLVESKLNTQLQQALGPVVEQIERMQSANDAQSLLQAFPEMADPKVAEAVVTEAQRAAQSMGADPRFATRPGFIELVYKAQKFDQTAAGEVPVGDLAHRALETGSGASPRGGEAPNLAKEIVAARGGNAFWGT